MELENKLKILEKPKIKLQEMPYIFGETDIYINLYELIINKDLKIYQYPFIICPKVEDGDIRIRQKLSKALCKKLKEIYGEYFISGNSLYSMKKVEEIHTVQCSLLLKEKTTYSLNFNKHQNERCIKNEDIGRDSLSKQFIEMIIRDILYANPRLESYKNFFVIADNVKKIETEDASIKFYPGFTTSFVETDSGNYLNVILKNKIIQNETILDYLKNYKYNSNDIIIKKIKEELIGKSFKVSYAKRNYKIDDILFDRNPKNQVVNYEGGTKNLIEYYEIAHKLKIRDETQPIIVARRKNSKDQPVNLYFIPELCYPSDLDEGTTKNYRLMKDLSNYCKYEPNDRVNKTNNFIQLFLDPIKDNKNPKKLSSKEKSELYGIEVKPIKYLFKAYYMKETKLIGGNNKEVSSKARTFPVFKMVDMTNWLCIYERCNYNESHILFDLLNKASKEYGLNITKPELIEISSESPAKEWIDKVEEYMGKNKNKYNFVVFLLGTNDHIYGQLKIHSLYQNNYISQVIKAKTLLKKIGIMSICSKIILQINNKLGGKSYILSIDKKLIDKKLMIIGVDSSHFKERTGIAMVATMNSGFDEYFNEEQIIKEKNKKQLQFSIRPFIEKAISAYKKENNEIPKGIIIYRQGVSFQEKYQLEAEANQIDFFCKDNNIFYYYILVNNKENYKFFEKEKKRRYLNLSSELLILDGITNRNFFEFYIQPQEVTQGSAIPICYHVAYGNLDIPEIIPKLTFDLCNLYSNWNGKVRVPNVLKMAEKLSKITAKYMPDEVGSEPKYGQIYI